jgi:glycosyltransferase involved in cell wall biosynthesis
MAYFVLWAMPAALQCVRSFRPDVIHVHFAVPTGAAAWVLSLLTRVPYVITAHLGDVPGGVPEQTDRLFRWIKPLTNPIWNKAAALTAVSSFVSDLAKRAYGRKPVVIPNGLRIDGRVDDGALPDVAAPPSLLFVGRMSVQKNPLLALEALALLKDLEWEAIIVGDGPLRKDAGECAIRCGIAGRVRFMGWLSAEELAAERRKCSILLMPSLAEGLPMAAVEALLDGLAIVGTEIPGLIDVVEPESNGILCTPEPHSFASGIRRLLENRSLLQSFREASRRMAQRFDLEKIVDRYEEVLQQAALKKNR